MLREKLRKLVEKAWLGVVVVVEKKKKKKKRAVMEHPLQKEQV